MNTINASQPMPSLNLTAPHPARPNFQAETLPARFKRLTMAPRPKQPASKLLGPGANTTRKRSPLSRCLSTNLPPIPRTIYSLSSQPRPLSRSSSMLSSSFTSSQSEGAMSSTSTTEPATPKSQTRSSLWIKMPNTPPEPQSPPHILLSKLSSKSRKFLRRSRTLEWACAKDLKQAAHRQACMSDENGYTQPFSSRLYFPCQQERVRGLGIMMDQEAVKDVDDVLDIKSQNSDCSRRSPWSSTPSTEDEMEVTTPTGSMETVTSYLPTPDIIITRADGVSDSYDVSYAERELEKARATLPSKEDEDAAVILMQLRHTSR